MGTSAQVISLAKAQVGYHEGKDANGNWDNVEKFAAQVPGLSWVSEDHEPWCAVFDSWALYKCGVGGFPITASVAVLRNWAKAHGRFTEYPTLGALALFHEADGGTEHTGIVYGWDASHVYTVDGNTNVNGSSEGDGVYLKSRARSATYGYLIPAYDEYATSADPAWNGRWLGAGKAVAPAKAAAKTTATTAKATKAKTAVSLSQLIHAAHADPGRPQGGITPGAKASVLAVERMLATVRLLDRRWVDGSYGALTVRAYAAWQRSLGYRGGDADGVPGTASLQKLIAKTGGQYTITK